MKKALKVALEKLREEPYASIICYPRPSKTELKKRLRELQKLGVKTIEFTGEKDIFDIPVLGKGCVGIVTVAYVNGEKVALKIRRVDADRSRMQHEAEMLKKANSVGVGPNFLGASQNFLLMQLIDGDLLPRWLEKRKGKAQVRTVLHGILDQCWRLDKASLDHGELSHAPKHLVVNAKREPFIVDFETASVNRKPSNVTSICQFLFIGSVVAEKVAEKLGRNDKKALIDELKNYKKTKNSESFRNVLRACGL